MRRSALLIVASLCLAAWSLGMSQELPGPPENKARVYFFHFLAPAAGRTPVQVYEGRNYLGLLESSHCYGVDLEPGEHLLWTRSANQSWFLRADVAAGRTYYVHLRMISPKFAGPLRPSLRSACRKDRQSRKTLKKIEERLAKGSFELQGPFLPERVEDREADMQGVIDTVMAKWDSVWSKQDNWDSLGKDDYVE